MSKDASESKQEISNRIGRVVSRLNNTGAYGMTMFKNGRHPVAFLRFLDDILKKDDDLARAVAREVGQGQPEQAIKSFACVYPLLGISDHDRASRLIRSLYNYRMVPPLTDISRSSPTLLTYCASILKVADAVIRLADAGDNEAYKRLEAPPFLARNTASNLRDPEMLAVVFDYHESGDRIAKLIEAHGTSDPSIIRGLLNGIAPSLAEGHL